MIPWGLLVSVPVQERGLFLALPAALVAKVSVMMPTESSCVHKNAGPDVLIPRLPALVVAHFVVTGNRSQDPIDVRFPVSALFCLLWLAIVNLSAISIP